MAAKADKKGKKKGKTMALTDFLSDEAGNVQGPGTSYVYASKTVDWAAEMEDADIDAEPSYGMIAVDRTKLPTAPKASRGPEDLSKVPTEPPFTAFIGNLPYDASEEKIMDFFQKLPVINVRLPDDNGRMRGFGYVQFETRQALIDALSMSEEILGGRKVRIDLAGESQHSDGRKGGGRSRDDGAPDRTEGNWRSESKSESGFSDRGRYDDRGPSRYDDRSSSGRYDDRGSGRYNDRGSSKYDSDRSSGRYDDRNSYDRDQYDGRNYGRGDDRGYGRYDDRRDDRGYGDRRGYGGDRDDRRGYGGDRDDRRGGYGRRDDRYGGGRDRYDDQYGGGRDRYNDRDGGRRGFGSGFRRDDRDDGGSWERGGGGDRERGYDRDGYSRQEREPEPPRERPRLQLQPRTKPVEITEEKKEPEPKSQRSSVSIFGSAKPVDTAQREREIEERLMKQKQEAPANKSTLESRGYGTSRGYEEPREQKRHDSHENKENRNLSRPEGSSRRRSGSDRSEDGDLPRQRRSSGSSKKKGSISSTRSRQDSGDHSAHQEVFSGGEEPKDDKTYNAISPAHREEPVKLVPAPPPKENIWEKRKSTQQQVTQPAPAQEAPKSPSAAPTSPSAAAPPQSQSKPQPPKSPSQSTPPQKTEAAPGKEVKREFIPAEPPKENPWTKRRQEQSSSSSAGQPAVSPSTAAPPSVPNAWAARGAHKASEAGRGSSHAPAAESARGGHAAGERGRGRGRGGFGRGRGSDRREDSHQKKHEKREKHLPQSVEEMPRLEEKKEKDFSDSNKFAGLLDDDDGDDEEES